MNLQEKIQKKFNRNFTNVSTKELEAFLNNALKCKQQTEVKKVTEVKKEFINLANSPFDCLIKILKKKHIISEEEHKRIDSMLKF